MKAYLEQVSDNATHINYEELTELVCLIMDFEDLFDGYPGDLDTEPVDFD